MSFAIILIILVGAYALSSSDHNAANITTATATATATEAATYAPTATPVANPTATPMPQGSGIMQTPFDYEITYPPVGYSEAHWADITNASPLNPYGIY